MRFFKKPFAFAVFYSVILILFTTYTLLDTFVIVHEYSVVTGISNIATDVDTTSLDSNVTDNGDETDDVQTTAPTVISANSYSDGNISITITTYRQYSTDIYVADVVLSDISYLKTAFANNIYARNSTQKTSAMAAANDAIFAVNGDFYGARTKGYVIRNGILYRTVATSSDQEDLVIYADGSFEIIEEGDITAQQLWENGALHVLSFGPALINNGSLSVTTSSEVDKEQTSNPRTAIGIIDKLHYVFVVSDGRLDTSVGLSLYELATFMKGLGVTTAYNLDGGGSATMYFNGEVINNPTTTGNSIQERAVSDIVYIG